MKTVKFIGTITTVSPVNVSLPSVKGIPKNSHNAYYIPASSLRGMLRSTASHAIAHELAKVDKKLSVDDIYINFSGVDIGRRVKLSGGYETVNKGEKNLSNGALITSRPGFIYGAFLGLDIDYSISDKLSLVLKANQYYHANSNLGEFVPFVGLGLKYYTD